MYIFAKEAQPIPEGVPPEAISQSVAYVSPPSDDFVDNGFAANEYVESSQFNEYLRELTQLIDNLENKGVVDVYPTCFIGEGWTEGDLRRSPDDPSALQIYKNGKWIYLLEEASETENGFIDLAKILTTTNPLDTVPYSTHDIPGKLKIDNYYNEESFKKLQNCNSRFPETAEENDDNDYGESHYFNNAALKIKLFPNRDTSKFYLKHITFGDNTTVSVNSIDISNVSGVPLGKDLFVLNNGNLFG
jgi:hypothetical protein